MVKTTLSRLKQVFQSFTGQHSNLSPRQQQLFQTLKRDDPLAIEAARGCVEPEDLDLLIAHYWQVKDWSKKLNLVELLQDQRHPGLPEMMLDFLRAPVVEGDEAMEQAQAIALGFVSEDYDNFTGFYHDRKQLRLAVATVLHKHNLTAEEPRGRKVKSKRQAAPAINPRLPANQRLIDGVLSGNLEVVHQALADGAIIDVTISRGDYQGCTPLIMALIWEQYDLAAYLIERGADVNHKRPASISSPDPDRGQTPLWWAATKGNLTLAQRLVSAGAAVDTPDHFGSTPFVTAASNGQLELVRYLLKAGANPEARISDGRSAFQLAVTNNHLFVVKFLLDTGWEVDEGSGNGFTPLMIAAWYNHYELAELLLRRGADVNAVCQGSGNYAAMRGYTPLVFAVSGGLVRMTRLLVKAGADVNHVVPARESWDGTLLPECRVPEFAMAGKRGESTRALLGAAGIQE